MNFENKNEKQNLALRLIDKLKKNDFNEHWSVFNQVLSFHSDDLWKVKELHFYSKEKPTVTNNTLSIASIGDFTGDITISDKTYKINLNNI